jgi:hypothetical protein
MCFLANVPLLVYVPLLGATVGLVLLTTVAAALAPVPVCAPTLAPLKPDLCSHLQLQKKTEGLPFPQKLIRQVGAGATGASSAKCDLDNPRLYGVYLTVSMRLREKLEQGVILPGFGIRYENFAGVKSWNIEQEEGTWEDSDDFSSDYSAFESEFESDSDFEHDDFEHESPAKITKKAGHDQAGPSSAKSSNPPAAASRQTNIAHTNIALYFEPKASQKGNPKDPIELSDSPKAKASKKGKGKGTSEVPVEFSESE